MIQKSRLTRSLILSIGQIVSHFKEKAGDRYIPVAYTLNLYTGKKPTMTLEQYNNLSEEDQQSVLDKEAVHIATINYNNSYYQLFQVGSFYIEMEFPINSWRTKVYVFFDELDYLEPYLNLVDISTIYKVLGS